MDKNTKRIVMFVVSGLCIAILIGLLPSFTKSVGYTIRGGLQESNSKSVETALDIQPGALIGYSAVTVTKEDVTVKNEESFAEAAENIYESIWNFGKGQGEELIYGLSEYYVGTQTHTSETSTEALPQGRSEVHIIDCGQGNAVLILADGKSLLYDGGNWDTKEMVYDYIAEQGVTHLDYIIVSHYDADHVAGAIYCMERMADTTTIVQEPDYVHDTETYETLMEVQNEINIVPVYPEVGAVYQLGNGVFTVVCPVTGYEEPNDNSIGIRFVYGEDSILLTGDAEVMSETDFVEYCNSEKIILDSDIYLCGHHGSSSSSTQTLLDAVTPDKICISVGENEYGHPANQIMDRIWDSEAELYRTDMQGTIIFEFSGKGITTNVNPCEDYSPGY